MQGKRIKIEVTVDMDPVPGWGNTPGDWVAMIQTNLDDRVPHYNPEVKYVGKVEEREKESA